MKKGLMLAHQQRKSMIKICFVTTVSITFKSFLLDFAKYLTENDDYDVTFICNDDDSLNEYTNKRIHYIPVKMKRGVGFDGFKVIGRLTKIFKEQQFDIIQYSTPNASLYASIAAKKAKCKNRLYCQWGIRYMGFSKGLSRSLFKKIEKTICKKSTVIEVESNSLMEFGLKEGLYKEDKVSVIGEGSACGVNLSKYDISKKDIWRKEIRESLGIPENAFVFGYAGRVTRDKGVNELFEAFKVVNNPDAYLLIVGKFDNENTIKNDLKEWAINDEHVIFVDWTSEIEKYYAALDVFVSLSYREGFGLVVIEAAAMGIPCIVTNVPGQIDTINDHVEGILVNDKNVEDVVAAMQYYLRNQESANQYGNNARKRVEEKFEQKVLFEKLSAHRSNLL